MPGTRIALDVMGGDRAPEAILEGALSAASEAGSLRIAPERLLLVGDEGRIRALLEDRGGNPGFAIQHASQVIEMGDAPSQALRQKPDSSIAVCVGAVKAGEAGAFVSMGNTGAVVGASTLMLKTLPGVKRPGIAVTMSLTGRPLTFLDMGANIATKPQHMQQYAVMGSIYARDCLGEREARVGLLNIGEEAGKGTSLLKEAHALLSAESASEASPIEFVGNIEPGDLFLNKAEIVITDGFTGNIVLKMMEGFAGFLFQLIGSELASHGLQPPPEALASVRRSIDYSEYGGALLLGVQGVVVIGHGRSEKNAVANAIAQACRALDAQVNDHIVEGLASADALVESDPQQAFGPGDA